MSTQNMAVRLNVLQCQMSREWRQNLTIRLPLGDTIREWQAELRKIELELRGIDEQGNPT